MDTTLVSEPEWRWGVFLGIFEDAGDPSIRYTAQDAVVNNHPWVTICTCNTCHNNIIICFILEVNKSRFLIGITKFFVGDPFGENPWKMCLRSL